jgi:hypothetical protein
MVLMTLQLFALAIAILACSCKNAFSAETRSTVGDFIHARLARAESLTAFSIKFVDKTETLLPQRSMHQAAYYYSTDGSRQSLRWNEGATIAEGNWKIAFSEAADSAPLKITPIEKGVRVTENVIGEYRIGLDQAYFVDLNKRPLARDGQLAPADLIQNPLFFEKLFESTGEQSILELPLDEVPSEDGASQKQFKGSRTSKGKVVEIIITTTLDRSIIVALDYRELIRDRIGYQNIRTMDSFSVQPNGRLLPKEVRISEHIDGKLSSSLHRKYEHVDFASPPQSEFLLATYTKTGNGIVEHFDDSDLKAQVHENRTRLDRGLRPEFPIISLELSKHGGRMWLIAANVLVIIVLAATILIFRQRSQVKI